MHGDVNHATTPAEAVDAAHGREFDAAFFAFYDRVNSNPDISLPADHDSDKIPDENKAG